MASTANDQIPAYLRHEYRTPVNHIVGYSELLIDESRERQLETWVPAFRQIQQGGRRLLELIQNAFRETAGQHGRDFRDSDFGYRGPESRTLRNIRGSGSDLRRHWPTE
jgi:signal transduction histidine kinase